MTITFEGPAIFVADMQAARAFYEGLLGQEVLADFGANVPFKSGFSLWLADHAMGVIYSGARQAREKQGQDNFEMYFEAQDLDAVWERVEKMAGHHPAGARGPMGPARIPGARPGRPHCGGRGTAAGHGQPLHRRRADAGADSRTLGYAAGNGQGNA